MAKINLDKLSLDELKSHQKDVQSAIANYEKKKRMEARKAIEAVAKEHGLSLNDILKTGGSTAKRSKAAPKYRNPANSDQTWSGRGRQPVWYKDAIAAGTKPEKLEI